MNIALQFCGEPEYIGTPKERWTAPTILAYSKDTGHFTVATGMPWRTLAEIERRIGEGETEGTAAIPGGVYKFSVETPPNPS